MRVTLTAELTNLWPSFPDRIGICSAGVCGGRKTEEPGEKPSEQGREPTKKLNPHMILGSGIETEPQR